MKKRLSTVGAAVIAGAAVVAAAMLICLGGGHGAAAEVPQVVPLTTATTVPGPYLDLQWRLDPSSLSDNPESNQVMMAPAVADVNGDGSPEVVFTTFKGGPFYNYVSDGIIRVVRGGTGVLIYSIDDPAYRVVPIGQIAVADIDNDNSPEIVAIRDDQGGTVCNSLIAFDGPTGLPEWIGDCVPVGAPDDYHLGGGPTIAHDPSVGTVIVVGQSVYDNQGNALWSVLGSTGGDLSCVADLDQDWTPEVIAGNTAAGSVSWHNALAPDGFCAVADFFGSGSPQVVDVGDGQVWLLDGLTGATVLVFGGPGWPQDIVPGITPGSGSGGGPPCVADFDGDTHPEIGVAGAAHPDPQHPQDTVVHLSVFRGNGSLMWTYLVQDSSSVSTSCAAFDFDLNGAYEIAYRDEDRFYIFDGSTGTVLFRTAVSGTWFECPSGTMHEMPVVANIDNDAYAEVVVPCNNYGKVAHNGSGGTGIEVYEGNQFLVTGRIWNEHTYHITNVDWPGTVPIPEVASWLDGNKYRAQPSDPCSDALCATVGGTVELHSDGSASSARAADGGGAAPFPFPAIAGGIAAAALLALTAGAWYARRRWNR